MVSLADAQAGTSTANRTWTASRVKSAIDALADSTPPTTLGVVGTYSLLSRTAVASGITQGSTYAGSTLDYAGYVGDSSTQTTLTSKTTTSPSGTWRAMGYSGASPDRYSATIFVRIS